MKLFICDTCNKKFDMELTNCTQCNREVKMYEISESTQSVRPEYQSQIYMQNINRQQMSSASDQSNYFAIAGFVLSFFYSVLGLIFSCIGLSRSKKINGKGRKLSIAGICISIVSMVIVFIIAVVSVSAGVYTLTRLSYR
ncbi:DUF4190 domain-containing protein [Mycoplasma tauri]|uniref:DUF4190 domain-containing protein n=1 Tax=Mycoplasma tauri TaxID=547987 RepID=UPI001CBD4B63|nr:DUF4190 domain-containing protein [Mycoplasma tauri]MBZ4218031.1 hypothetical protein [Mycoplasma tauri]